MIPRTAHVDNILDRLNLFPAVAILGPRQVGKTTLSEQTAAAFNGPSQRFDLENPRDLNRLLDDPLMALEGPRGLVIIDEVQRRPDLFPVLRVLCDRRPSPAKFLILGSASPELIKQTSETLAGRIHYYNLGGLNLNEVGFQEVNRLWLRGGFPPAWLAKHDIDAALWTMSLVRSFLERDLPELGVRVASTAMRRFWTMLAHWQGQTWNSSVFARSFGVADTTVRRYLDILTGALVVRQLPPWFENIRKRQVKAPKIYLRDTGVLHTLLGIEDADALHSHPACGASWEGFLIESIIQLLELSEESVYFWGTHTGAEIDLLVTHAGKRFGIEIKRTTSPKVTPSMRSALEALQLEEVIVVHAGEESYRLAPQVRAVSAQRLNVDIEI
ncbi:MAG: ATP-binding protein [Gammaproteobacteria bacterium]|nr:ATP-binding protein [Gammaproteobacteria bacterium]MCY4277442.1 ATP-binding protein [Gammaproteobacteria bacterium]